MQNSQNKKSLQIVLIVLIAVVTLGIGYAAISAVNLIINGNATASVNQENCNCISKPRKLQGTFHTGTKYYWFNRSKWNIKYRYTG